MPAGSRGSRKQGSRPKSPSSADSASFQRGDAEARPAVAAAVVQHVLLAPVLEYAGIADRIGVPAAAGRLDPRPLIEAFPAPAALAFGIADAVLAATTGVPHAVAAVLPQHAGARKPDLARLQVEQRAAVPVPPRAIGRSGVLQDMLHVVLAAPR